MDPRLDVLQRMLPELHQQLGEVLDAARMLAEPLYERDVLLVCDAFAGTTLPQLAREYRQASAAWARAPAAASPRTSTERRRGA